MARLARMLRRTRSASALAIALGLLCVAAPVAHAQVQAEFSDEYDAPGKPPPERPDAEAKERPDAEPKPAPETRESQLLRVQNTWLGPSGGLHVPDAGSGIAGTLRLQLGVDFFASSNFLLAHDKDHYSGEALSLSWTLTDFLELYGSLESHANSNDQEQPRLLQVIGDTLVGLKAFHTVLPWLTLGGDVRLGMLSSVGGIGPVLSALSLGLRGNASADLRQLDDPYPLIARLSLGYFFDNSSTLIQSVENERYAALGAAARPRAEEDRNLVRRVERFGLGINRTDAFNVALGLEAPLRAAEDFYIHPLLEWTLGVPVNRQGYSCLLLDTNAGPADTDGCLKRQGFAAMPSTLSLGARVFPPVRGLSLLLAVDIGVSGTSTFVRELAPNKPYDVLLALGYAIDPRERKVEAQQVEVVREVTKPEPPKPRVEGYVVEAGTGTKIAGATIGYPGRELTAQQTDTEGRFVSYELEPGEVRFEISHPDYEPGVCSVQIEKPAPAPKSPAAPGGGKPAAAAPATTGTTEATAPAATPAGGAAPNTSTPAAAAPVTPLAPPLVPLRCELTAKPRTGSVRGTVESEAGKAVAGARVELIGPASQS
ncbi:MAG: hypothetical protein ACHQ53_12040, partial [Polyangiales bacterium]